MTSKFFTSSVRSVSRAPLKDPSKPASSDVVQGMSINSNNVGPTTINAVVTYPIYTPGYDWREIVDTITLSVVYDDNKPIERTASYYVNQAQSSLIPTIAKGTFFKPGTGAIPISAREPSCRNYQLFNKTLEYSNWRLNRTDFSWEPSNTNIDGILRLVGDNGKTINQFTTNGFDAKDGRVSFHISRADVAGTLKINNQKTDKLLTRNTSQGYDGDNEAGYIQWFLEMNEVSDFVNIPCKKLGTFRFTFNVTFDGYSPMTEFMMIPEWAAEQFPIGGSDNVSLSVNGLISNSTYDPSPFSSANLMGSLPIMLEHKRLLNMAKNEPEDTVAGYLQPDIIELGLTHKSFKDDVERGTVNIGHVLMPSPVPAQNIAHTSPYVSGSPKGTYVDITQEVLHNGKTERVEIANKLLQIKNPDLTKLKYGMLISHLTVHAATADTDKYQVIRGANLGLLTSVGLPVKRELSGFVENDSDSVIARSLKANLPKYEGSNSLPSLMGVLSAINTCLPIANSVVASLVKPPQAYQDELGDEIPVYSCGTTIDEPIIAGPKQEISTYTDSYLVAMSRAAFGNYKWAAEGKFGKFPDNVTDTTPCIFTADSASKDIFAFQVFIDGQLDTTVPSKCATDVFTFTTYLVNSMPFDGSDEWINSATPINNYLSDYRQSRVDGVVASKGAAPVINTILCSKEDGVERVNSSSTSSCAYCSFLTQSDNGGSYQFLLPSIVNGTPISRLERVYFGVIKASLFSITLPALKSVNSIYITKDNKNYRPRKVEDGVVLFSERYVDSDPNCLGLFMSSYNRRFDFTMENTSKTTSIPINNDTNNKRKKKSNIRNVSLKRKCTEEEDESD